MKTVAGKKILITGAAMGMGHLYAELAVKEGAEALVLWDINTSLLNQVTTELKAKGNTTIYAESVDISQLSAIAAAKEKVLRELGMIDILINNAGIIRAKYFWEHDNNDILLSMAVNALAPMLITRAFLPSMMSAVNNECRIVNIASAASMIANPRMSVYCASKSACVGFSDSLRLELKQQNIKHICVTTVCPSYITTGMFAGVKSMPLVPLLKPEDVVKKVWQAMKQGRPRLLLPKSLYLAQALKGLLPVQLFDFILDRLGIYKSMQTFKGRK